MSNYTQKVYCPKCDKITDHDFQDLRGIERSASGCYYEVVCGVCGHERWEDELEVKESDKPNE